MIPHQIFTAGAETVKAFLATPGHFGYGGPPEVNE
jgi:hypothetical protein